VLLGLSGAADECGDSRREIAVLKADACLELGCEARGCGVRLLALDEVDSTNDEGKRLVAEGERGPLWIVAGRQSRGRGRLGRQWVSTPGNLHASLVLSGGSMPSLAPQLGFVAGVALIDAVRRVSGLGERLALKWPNDLLLDGGKLAGVLLEGVPIATGDPRAPNECVVVVGIGVNCASAPQGLLYPARALSEAGSGAPTAARLFAPLTDAFVGALDLWASGDGFTAIREKWLGSAAALGQPVRVALARGEELRGRFKTIDALGRMVVATVEGERLVDAGDVFLAHDESSVLEQSGLRS
jgi:BirA family biotin operon repressor/biotin-[acetyl-CoA-carboxylase] ligase